MKKNDTEFAKFKRYMHQIDAKLNKKNIELKKQHRNQKHKPSKQDNLEEIAGEE